MKRTVALTLSFVFAAALAVAQSKKIVAVHLDAKSVQELQAAVPGANIVAVEPRDLANAAVDADAILGGVNPAVLRAAKKLKWVQIYSAGAEGVLSPELKRSNVTLTNCKILQGPNIADHALALLLALTRDLHLIIPSNRTSQEWRREQDYRPIELTGKTAVVVGLGGIGMQIAQRAHAFGMNVIGVDPKDVSYTYFVKQVVPPDRLDSVLPQADVLFVSAPLTEQSRGIIGARQFELMKPNSYFIAVSRGRLYDTDALMKALDSKHLAGAGLDVTNPEPLPKGHPLWKFENVIITPHIAGQSDEVEQRRMALIKENVQRFVKGEPLLNVVDKEKGY